MRLKCTVIRSDRKQWRYIYIGGIPTKQTFCTRVKTMTIVSCNGGYVG